MDKNQITGIILMVVLYVGYIWYSTPSEEERNAAIAEQERLVEEARKDMIEDQNNSTKHDYRDTCEFDNILIKYYIPYDKK
mgnify:CR=1 FL=1